MGRSCEKKVRWLKIKIKRQKKSSLMRLAAYALGKNLTVGLGLRTCHINITTLGR